jgi:RHH-type rel operon transcriptional repressor/antitoxin RelB
MDRPIRISPELSERIDRLAVQTGRTRAFYLREMIEKGISEVEDYFFAVDTRERVRKGQERAYAADSVRKDLGLDG